MQVLHDNSGKYDPASLTIRFAQPNDAPQVAQLYRTVYGQDYPSPELFTETGMFEFLTYERSHAFTYLMIFHGNVVAAATFQVQGGAALSRGFMVTPSMQGKIGARQVFQRILQDARHDLAGRVEYFYGECRTATAKLQGVIEEVGWRPLGTLPFKDIFARGRETEILYAYYFHEPALGPLRLTARAAQIASIVLQRPVLPARGPISLPRNVPEVAYKVALGQRAEATAKYWFDLGVERYERQDLTGAVEAFKSALTLDPNDAKTWLNLGDVKYDQEDYSGAEEAYKKTLDLDPKDALAWNGLGNCMSSKGDDTGAIKDYEKAVELDPKNSLFWCNLGDAKCDQDDFSGAVKAYENALGLAPGDADADIWNNLGNCKYSQGDSDGAVKDYEKAVELDPKDAVKWYNLGNARRLQGNLDGALNAFEKSLSFDPEDADARKEKTRVEKEKAEVETRRKTEAEEHERIDRLKELVEVSLRLNRKDIGQYLGLTGDALFQRLVKWAKQFGFKLDGEDVIFEGGRKDDFIAQLEKEFQSWGKDGKK